MKVIEINNKNAEKLGFLELYYYFAIAEHWRVASLKKGIKTAERERAERICEYHTTTYNQMVESLPHKYKANFTSLEVYDDEQY